MSNYEIVDPRSALPHLSLLDAQRAICYRENRYLRRETTANAHHCPYLLSCFRHRRLHLRPRHSGSHQYPHWSVDGCYHALYLVEKEQRYDLIKKHPKRGTSVLHFSLLSRVKNLPHFALITANH